MTDQTDALIKNAYASAKDYPDLAGKLAAAGVQSYTVDVSTRTILYRLDSGRHLIHSGSIEPCAIEKNFDRELIIRAVRDSQQRKIDYPGFMAAIALAGVRFYEAQLQGEHRSVTYIGYGGHYEEAIPL